MADPTPAAPPSPAPAPAPAAPAARPGSLTGTRYDTPISDRAFDQLGPHDQSRFMRVRDRNNNPQWVLRNDLAPDPGPVPPKPATAPGEPPAPAPAASVVDGKLRVGDYVLDETDIAGLMQARARSRTRLLRSH